MFDISEFFCETWKTIFPLTGSTVKHFCNGTIRNRAKEVNIFTKPQISSLDSWPPTGIGICPLRLNSSHPKTVPTLLKLSNGPEKLLTRKSIGWFKIIRKWRHDCDWSKNFQNGSKESNETLRNNVKLPLNYPPHLIWHLLTLLSPTPLRVSQIIWIHIH